MPPGEAGPCRVSSRMPSENTPQGGARGALIALWMCGSSGLIAAMSKGISRCTAAASLTIAAVLMVVFAPILTAAGAGPTGSLGVDRLTVTVASLTKPRHRHGQGRLGPAGQPVPDRPRDGLLCGRRVAAGRDGPARNRALCPRRGRPRLHCPLRRPDDAALRDPRKPARHRRTRGAGHGCGRSLGPDQGAGTGRCRDCGGPGRPYP